MLHSLCCLDGFNHFLWKQRWNMEIWCRDTEGWRGSELALFSFLMEGSYLSAAVQTDNIQWLEMTLLLALIIMSAYGWSNIPEISILKINYRCISVRQIHILCCFNLSLFHSFQALKVARISFALSKPVQGVPTSLVTASVQHMGCLCVIAQFTKIRSLFENAST